MITVGNQRYKQFPVRTGYDNCDSCDLNGKLCSRVKAYHRCRLNCVYTKFGTMVNGKPTNYYIDNI